MRLAALTKFRSSCLLLFFWMTTIFIVVYKQSAFNEGSKQGSERMNLIEGMDENEDRLEYETILQLELDKKSTKLELADPSLFCAPKFGNVTIFIAIDNLNLTKTKTKYKDAISSLTCYAKRRGYKLIIIDAYKDLLVQKSCSHLKSLLFLRHCASAIYLSKTDWLLVLDADNGVINFDHCIEEYIRPEVDVIHSERFHNGEITASNYIVKNSQYSYDYLMRWSNYESRSFANYDNGALHYHLLTSLQLEWMTNETLAACEKMGRNFARYSNFVGCVKKALLGKRNFKHVKIYRRGLGFARDSWVTDHNWSELDFILHAMKPPDNVHFETDIDIEQCSSKEWTLPVKSHLKRTVDDMIPLVKKADAHAVSKFPLSLLNSADVSNCWPSCPEDVE